MNFYFVIGEPVRMQFSVAGAAPAPEPEPETPHTWTMKCNGLDGEIGTYTVPQDPPPVSQN